MSSGQDSGLTDQHEVPSSTKPTGVRFPSRNYDDDWTRTLDAFEIIQPLGEGTFGWVQKARDRQTGQIVALKKIKMENETEGFPITAIREIKILKTIRDRLKTANVVLLKEVVAAPEKDMNSDDKGSIYLVFEYMEHDLAGLMDLRWDTKFRPESVKCFMKQLLEGLYALHLNKIIHRDIKASNLLVSNAGILKIADFGLARPQCDEPYKYTANVITLWYRPPELLLCDTKTHPSTVYSTYVDIWSAGCILAEMLFHQPLFKGKTEMELLEAIYKVLGTPTPATHPELFPPLPTGPPPEGMARHPPSPYEVWRGRLYKPGTIYPSRLHEMCKQHKVPEKTYEFLSALLSYDPLKRLTAKEALDHDWFWTDPLPCEPQDIGSCPPSNEYIAKKQKEEEKNRQGGVGSGLRPPIPPGAHPMPPKPYPGIPPPHHAGPHGPRPPHGALPPRGPYPPPGRLPHQGPLPHGSHPSAHGSHAPPHGPHPPHPSQSGHPSQNKPPYPPHPSAKPHPPPGSSSSGSSGTSAPPPGHRYPPPPPPPHPPASGSQSAPGTHGSSSGSQPRPPGYPQGHPTPGAGHPAPPSYKPPPPPASMPPSHSAHGSAPPHHGQAPPSSSAASSSSFGSHGKPPHPPPSSSHGSSHPGHSSSQPHYQHSHAHHGANGNRSSLPSHQQPVQSAYAPPRAQAPPPHAAPSAAATATANGPHYPPSEGSGYVHNADNPNKRYKMDEPVQATGAGNGSAQ